MKKHDFELIASILKQETENTDNSTSDNLLLEYISRQFTNTLAKKYPRFQKDKFLKACGVEVEERGKDNECFDCGNKTGECLCFFEKQ